MKSLRGKIALFTTVGTTLAIALTAIVAAVTIADLGHHRAEESLALLCETGQSRLESYFQSVEQSVDTVTDILTGDLSDVDLDTGLSAHVERSREVFSEMVEHTSGVLTYYYRIDPERSSTEKGYWYTNLDGKGFTPETVTEIASGEGSCRWFYETKESGSKWLEPYMTDGLDGVYVISYNASVKKDGLFVGVVGIEISYSTLGSIIDDITMLDSGLAFIVNSKTGSIVCHPKIDTFGKTEAERPAVPTELQESLSETGRHITYHYEGVEKHAFVLPLSIDMCIVMAVPSAEVNRTWVAWINRVILIASGLIVLTIAAALLLSRRITKPLENLRQAAAEIDQGNYDLVLVPRGEDEIADLTRTVNHLIEHLRDYIADLNHLAYADPLTEVRNKSAFDVAMQELQRQLDAGESLEFAIAMLDCDDLKYINDEYGHEKGDIYLRNACHLMCRVFGKSVVYRIGGDEFAILLQGEDYDRFEARVAQFNEKSKQVCALAKEPWEQIRVSVGIAVYDPQIDHSAKDVLLHADRLMYVHKRSRKAKK